MNVRFSKQILVLVMVLAALLVLGACSSASTTAPGTTTTTVPAATTTTPPATTTMPPMTTMPATTTPPLTTTTSPTTTQTNGPAVTINLVAQNFAFLPTSITVPAGARVTMNFDNKDSVPHNFALYTNSSATTVIFQGQVVNGTKITYTFTAPSTPGTYFFRCDIHPASMTGSFIVQ